MLWTVSVLYSVQVDDVRLTVSNTTAIESIQPRTLRRPTASAGDDCLRVSGL